VNRSWEAVICRDVSSVLLAISEHFHFDQHGRLGPSIEATNVSPFSGSSHRSSYLASHDHACALVDEQGLLCAEHGLTLPLPWAPRSSCRTCGRSVPRILLLRRFIRHR